MDADAVVEEEQFCEYVSSRGILKSCICRSSRPKSSIRAVLYQNFDNLEPNAIIYICSSALQDFTANHLPNIKTPFILVSGDADAQVPTGSMSLAGFKQLYKNEYLVAWYSQNLVFSPKDYPKFHYFPIGLDYHTLSDKACTWGPMSSPKKQEDLLKAVASRAVPFWERKPMAYTTFHFEIDRGKRQEAVEQIPSDLVYYESKRVFRMASWRNQTKYAFVVSPPGKGYDCHRTWEALCLGCIPILISSPLDNMFEDLPVLIVSSWADLTQELLDNTIAEFRNREFKMEKLMLKYWMDRVQASGVQASGV